jgi:hypothetical protein
MPHEYAIDTAKRLVKARMWGDLNRAEVLKAALELSADPRLLPGFSELIDLREASATSISAEDVRAIASAPLDPAARRAFVVPACSPLFASWSRSPRISTCFARSKKPKRGSTSGRCDDRGTRGWPLTPISFR